MKLQIEKGSSSVTLKCKDKTHYMELLARFKRKGYRHVPYVDKEGTEVECLPF